MGFAVFADKARPVNGNNGFSSLKRAVMDKLVGASLQKCGINRKYGQHTACRKSACKGYGVFFGNADIKKSLGKLL